MGRPVKFNRAAAIETVMNHMWEGGFESSSVKSIAEKLKITRSSFYNSFGTREALFLAALDLYCTRSPDYALAEARKGVSVKTLFSRTFRAAVRARIEDEKARGCFAINSVTELCQVHKELGPVLEELVLGTFDRITELLDWAVEVGEIPPETDTRAMALSVQSLLVGLNVLSKVIRDEETLWSGARTTLDALGLLDPDFA